MRKYTAYILRHLLMPTSLITIALVCVAWLSRSLRYIEIIINQGFPVSEFLYFVALLIPELLEFVMPISVFCATIYVYNKLIYDSELLVLQAAGLSNLNLARPVIAFGALIMFFGYLLSLYLQPIAAREFRDLQFKMRDSYSNFLLREGVFNTPIQGFTIYVRKRFDDGTLGGILVHDSRDPEKTTTMMAEQGKISAISDGLKIYMKKASRHIIDKKTGEVSILYFESYPAEIKLEAKNKTERVLKKDERFLTELLFPEVDIGNKEQDKFNAEAHQRITWPMLNLTLPLLVIATMLSGDFNRRGQSKKIVSVIVVGISLVLIEVALKNLAAGGAKLGIYGLYLAQLVAIGLALAMLAGLNFRKPTQFQTEQ